MRIAGLVTFLLAGISGVLANPTPWPPNWESQLAKRYAGSYPGFKRIKHWFSFGDSYTQTGFNMTNGSPMPSVGNPLGNPPFPGWTSSNGPNWVGYLTTKYNASTLLTYNLAYGGATIDSALVKPWRDDVLSLKDQVEKLFLPILAPANKTKIWRPETSLFSFWIGINDIGNSYWTGDFETFHTTLLDTYFMLIDKLYAIGARNFLFINVPPVDKSPLTMAQGQWSMDTEKEAIKSFNTMLAARAKDYSNKKWGVWTKVFDANAVYEKILAEPCWYGLTNTTAYCGKYENGTPEWDTFYPECGIPVDEYFWLNSLHPGHKVNDAMAKELAKQL